MINKKMKCLYIVIAVTMTMGAHAFDLEDYATTYNQTRDAYNRAENELEASAAALIAAEMAYIDATKSYTSSLNMPELGVKSERVLLEAEK